MTRLPTLRGRDLTGAARTLPDDLAGGRSVLLVGFAEAHQAFLDLWLAALEGTGVPLVEVPVAGTGDERFARTIEGGMVPGVPRDRHAETVVVYTDRQALRTALGLRGPVPAVVVLDEHGVVRAVSTREPDGAAAAAVRSALAG